jgi:hypothetical protein
VTRELRRVAFAASAPLAACLHLACAESPTRPAAATLSPAGGAASAGQVNAHNVAPRLSFRSQPAADLTRTPPTITGQAPLTVTFNLCASSDADQGDSLNWQFHFGDSNKPAFNPDGTFNPDIDHTCRVEHEYREGTWTATLSVTDKHLEDQGLRSGAGAAARTTQQVRVVAFTTPPPEPTLYCQALNTADGLGNVAACPSAAQFCDTEPIVATRADQAQKACDACYGGGCFASFAAAAGGLGYRAPVGNVLFLYTGTAGGCGPSVPAGVVFDIIPCVAAGRWAP